LRFPGDAGIHDLFKDSVIRMGRVARFAVTQGQVLRASPAVKAKAGLTARAGIGGAPCAAGFCIG
jgi:hypothetical protein